MPSWNNGFLRKIPSIYNGLYKNELNYKCILEMRAYYKVFLKMPSITVLWKNSYSSSITDFCEKCHNVNAGFKNVIFGITEFEENAVTLH